MKISFKLKSKKMKKLRTFVAILATVAVGTGIFYACQKENNENDLLEKTKKANSSSEDDYISYEDVVEIANMHNYYLDQIFGEFNFYSDDYLQELQERFYSTECGISMEEKHSIWSDVIHSDNDHEQLMAMIDEGANNGIIHDKDMVKELVSISIQENMFETGIVKIHNHVNNIQEIANSKLFGVDKAVVLTYTEVVKKSAEYWLSAELGGIGFGNTILEGTCVGCNDNGGETSASETAKTVAKVVAADAFAAGKGMIRVAFKNPTVSGLVWVAVKTAISSARQAIKESN
jgi:hypothetical protein